MHFRFTEGDRERLRSALNQAKDIRGFRRVQAVLWVAEGCSVAEAARRQAVNRRSVYLWCQRYLRAGRRSPRRLLEEKPRSGRPHGVLAKISPEMLTTILDQSPLSFGYQSTGWTLALLATHRQKELGGERPSRSALRRHLHALNGRWKRPRFVFSEPDPQSAQKNAPFSRCSTRCLRMLESL